jgi:hypothetical protein
VANRIDFVEITPRSENYLSARPRLDHGLQGDIGQRTIASIIGQLDEIIGGAESCVGEMQGDVSISRVQHYPKRNVASTLRTLRQ